MLAPATGLVARHLVRILDERGATLLLAGHDADDLRRLFPGHTSCRYDQLEEQAAGFDRLVDLSKLDNTADASPEGRRDAGAGPWDDMAQLVRRAGVSCLVSVVPFHFGKGTSISISPVASTESVTLAIPAVQLDKPRGWPACPVSKIKSALMPTLGPNRLADVIMREKSGVKGGQIILTDGQAHNRIYRFMKRFIDLGFALFVVIFLWWLLALVWVLVKLQSPGPGIFAQERVGRDGQIFTCYKFRTMYLGTIQGPTNQVPLSQVTRLGHILRRSKLDELPQVWNILRNEFSLIGPRPCLPMQTELIEARTRLGVLALKPGISGLSQVEGIEMSEPERLAINDARYLALQSLQMDAKILIETVAVVFRSLR